MYLFGFATLSGLLTLKTLIIDHSVATRMEPCPSLILTMDASRMQVMLIISTLRVAYLINRGRIVHRLHAGSDHDSHILAVGTGWCMADLIGRDCV